MEQKIEGSARTNDMKTNMRCDPVSTAGKAFDEVLAWPLSPQSLAYRLGLWHRLQEHLDGQEGTMCPFPSGSLQARAYCAGLASADSALGINSST